MVSDEGSPGQLVLSPDRGFFPHCGFPQAGFSYRPTFNGREDF